MADRDKTVGEQGMEGSMEGKTEHARGHVKDAGGGAEPAQYGQVSYFGIGADADVEAAQEFIRYLLPAGYAAWPCVAPPGQFPSRLRTAASRCRASQPSAEISSTEPGPAPSIISPMIDWAETICPSRETSSEAP